MQVTFRELTVEDIPVCLSILQENYSKEEEKFWQDILKKDFSEVLKKSYTAKCLMVTINETIIGFGCWVKQKTGLYTISWMNILPREQGKGIGKKLVRELEKHIKKDCKLRFCIMLETDKPFFYKKLGYETFNKNGNNDLMKKNF